MNKEINYLKEHLYEIYKYKKSQKDLTYDMDLELLLRTCKALDFKQKENIQLQSNWNSLREWLKNKIDNFQDDVSEPILHEQMTMRVIYEYMENLDKMNELERKDNNE